MLRAGARMTRRGYPVSFPGMSEKMPYRGGQIVNPIENGDFFPQDVKVAEMVGVFRQKESAGAGNLEYPGLDLATAARNQSIHDNSRVAKIKADRRFPDDPRNVHGGDRAVRPPMAETGDFDSPLSELRDPPGPVAIGRTDKRYRITALTRWQRFLKFFGIGRPLRQQKVGQTVIQGFLQCLGIRRRVRMKDRRHKAGELRIFPRIIR